MSPPRSHLKTGVSPLTRSGWLMRCSARVLTSGSSALPDLKTPLAGLRPMDMAGNMLPAAALPSTSGPSEVPSWPLVVAV